MPVGQVVTGFETAFEAPYIWRRDRTRMIRLHADPREGLPSELFARVKPKIEKALGVDMEAKTGKAVPQEKWDADTIGVKYKDAIPLKDMPGYTIAWGGEAEDSANTQDGLAGYIPIFFGRQSVEGATRSVELSMTQYGEGLVDYQRVLDTQRFQTQAQDLLMSTRGVVLLNLIATYKALGGGWESQVGKDFVPEQIKQEVEKRTDWGHLLSPAEPETPPEA